MSTMSNITVISQSEKIDVTGKLVVENVWKVMKAAEPKSFFSSDVFHAEDFAFQLVIYLNGDQEEHKHNISAFIMNMTDDPVLLTNIYFELKAIPSNSTELLCLASKRREMTELPAGEAAGAMKLITHNGLKEACEEGDDLLLIVKAQLPGKEIKISSNTGTSSLNRTRKRKCCAGGVLENVYKKMEDADFALLCEDEMIPCHKIIPLAPPLFSKP